MADKYRVIRGQFVIIGKQPDGDSIRFKADDVALFDDLPGGGRVRVTQSDKTVQLRFQGIDAPELHFQGEEQPAGVQSRDTLLNEMDFGLVTYHGKTVTNAARTVRGAVLTRQAEKHGRPISYVLWHTDADGLADGTMVEIDGPLLAKTMNRLMLDRGMAYPLFYTSMPADHIADFREAAAAARAAEAGMWAQDTTRLFELVDVGSIGPNGQLIMPKLFRRCVEFLHQTDDENFDGGLGEWMQSRRQNDPVRVAGGPTVEFSTLIDVDGSTVRFNADPLDLVFVGD